MKKFILACLLVPLLINAYTLKDVIDACSIVADSSPSLLSAPCAGKAVTIEGKIYELRLFTFEQKGILEAATPKFKDFITQWKQLEVKPLQRAEAVIPTDYFSATLEMKEEGFFFLLALREITDSKLISKLKAR